MQPSGEPVPGCVEVSSEVLTLNETIASEGLDPSPSEPQHGDFDAAAGAQASHQVFFHGSRAFYAHFPARESFAVVRTCVAGPPKEYSTRRVTPDLLVQCYSVLRAQRSWPRP